MRKIVFEPCIPTRGTKVPAGPEWLHEIKHDGYRHIVQRDGARVRLFTRNGNDWTARYPLIVEAALKNKHQRLWRGFDRPRHRRITYSTSMTRDAIMAELLEIEGLLQDDRLNDN